MTLIDHVQQSIDRAWKHESRLVPETLEVRGKTAPKIRHCLNNLCSLPGTVYLEVGCWEGASLTAALCGNQDRIRQAFAVDCWNQYGNPIDNYSPPEQAFDRATAKFLAGYPWQKIRQDLFSVESLPLAPTVYYYDADHQITDKGAGHFFPMLADPCIVCLDDYSRDYVSMGWRRAVMASEWEIAQEWILPSSCKKDIELWWEGWYVAVLTRGTL